MGSGDYVRGFGNRREYPFCWELVHREAIVCSHCQRDLPKVSYVPVPNIGLKELFKFGETEGEITFVGYIGIGRGILSMGLSLAVAIFVKKEQWLPEIWTMCYLFGFGLLLSFAAYKWVRKGNKGQ